MKKIIAYYRSSTKEQHYSIDVQRTQMQEYICKNGFLPVAEYQEHHSGKDKTRMQLACAIKHCVNTGCTLAFTKLDRLSRQASHLYQIEIRGLILYV
jgi:DNA invertase Pin-like site-specific DNA recombinase